ncbi:hypothetical protein ACJJTC_008821 [Scirpophaga incertulas]
MKTPRRCAMNVPSVLLGVVWRRRKLNVRLLVRREGAICGQREIANQEPSPRVHVVIHNEMGSEPCRLKSRTMFECSRINPGSTFIQIHEKRKFKKFLEPPPLPQECPSIPIRNNYGLDSNSPYEDRISTRQYDDRNMSPTDAGARNLPNE